MTASLFRCGFAAGLACMHGMWPITHLWLCECSVAALFIMFREALEASIIISIMLQLCTRLKLNKLKKWGE